MQAKQNTKRSSILIVETKQGRGSDTVQYLWILCLFLLLLAYQIAELALLRPVPAPAGRKLYV